MSDGYVKPPPPYYSPSPFVQAGAAGHPVTFPQATNNLDQLHPTYPNQQQPNSTNGAGNMNQPQVVVQAVGGCPKCHAGALTDSFTCCGIALAIIFFPVGLVCCYVMREKKCLNCGETFG